MIKNYFKIAWRNLKHNKGFFALNFVGLYISVVTCSLITIIILYELSFDKNTGNGLSMYRITRETTNATGKTFEPITQYPLATAVRSELKDEKGIAQIHYIKDGIVNIGDKKLKETNIVFADSVFPALFPVKVIKGDVSKALAAPNFVVLTENAAKKYFGNDDPLGKRIRLENLADLEVTAVVENSQGNTHLPFNILVSFPTFKSDFINGLPLDQWGINIDGYTYIGLNNENKKGQIEAALATIADRNLNRNSNGERTKYLLQPITDIHYNQIYAESNVSYTINYQYLYLLGAIGLFLILAACINYTNLSTSLAIKKSKEVGIRKTLGANRSALIYQFLSETFLVTGLVVVAAAVSINFLIPSVNTFLEKAIPTNWLTFQTGAFLLILWVAVALLSGMYPAFVLSEFNPITALKNKFSTPKVSTVYLRKGLVVFQFLTAQILIIGAIVVAKQMHFIQSKPLGFQKELVVDINLPENKPEQLSAFRNKLATLTGINKFSFSLGAPISKNGFNTSFNRREKYASETMAVEVKLADKAYLETYGLQLKTGRWFNENDENKIDNTIPDSLRQYSAVLNEAAVKSLGYANAEEAIGQYVQFGLNNMIVPVIGVMKDYHVNSLHANITPVVMIQFPVFYYNAGIKLSSGNAQNTLKAIESVWSTVYPNHIFEANFLDEHIAQLYKEEKRTAQLFNLFTILSILINALGLIGLLAFMIEQKTKEIGIRKVLGATIANISYLLFKDFIWLIGIAFLIAVPISWYLMSRWLQDFAYRTDLSWWVFAVSGGVALLIAVLTVSFQAIKAAVANPVKSLRTE